MYKVLKSFFTDTDIRRFAKALFAQQDSAQPALPIDKTMPAMPTTDLAASGPREPAYLTGMSAVLSAVAEMLKHDDQLARDPS